MCCGTHGRSAAGRLILGSVAEETLRSAARPVMTVGPGIADIANHELPANPFTRILCAVDFSPDSRAALDLAIMFAEAANGVVRVLHVVEWWLPDRSGWLPVSNAAELRDNAVREARAQLEEFARGAARVELRDVVAAERSHAALLDESNARPTDLIALGTRGRDAIEGLLVGSTTSRVVREARCPVLATRGA